MSAKDAKPSTLNCNDDAKRKAFYQSMNYGPAPVSDDPKDRWTPPPGSVIRVAFTSGLGKHRVTGFEYFLVGDVNELGGSCDCCSMISAGTIDGVAYLPGFEPEETK